MLPFLILLPLGAAVLLAVLRFGDPNRVRWVTLLATVGTMLFSLAVANQFWQFRHPAGGSRARSAPAESRMDPLQPRMEWRHAWMTYHQKSTGGENSQEGAKPQEVRFEFYLGIDGISLVLILLTTLLTVSSVLVSWRTVQERVTEFHICLLVLETGLIGVFCAFDLLLFYVFFEFTLIPLFLMVGVWGGTQRRYAAAKFFIYTLAGSVVTLLGLVALVLSVWGAGDLSSPFSIPDMARFLQASNYKLLGSSTQQWLFLALSAGFLIKVPLFPFHTWLPLAHVEAPTAGSVLLAGVLLKLGTYGFLRLCLPLLPVACKEIGVPLIVTLSLIGIIYGALCALAQTDIKKLVAYSSISHLGFCMLGLFALNSEGISGGVMQMVNHGLSTGALFLLVGMLYERYHTRELRDLGGLTARLPLLGWAMVFVCLSSMGLPGLNGFVGEVLCLIGMFRANPVYAVIGTSGVVLGAWYLLTMLQRGFFGPLREPHHEHDEAPIHDLGLRELTALVPIMVLCVVLGVYPQPMLETIHPDVASVARIYGPLSWQDEPAARQQLTTENRRNSMPLLAGEKTAEAHNDNKSIDVAVRSETKIGIRDRLLQETHR